jgi:hypothetical protein
MSVLKKLQHEFLLVLPPTIFFFMGFTLISITQRLILREHDMPLTGFGAAAIGALVVGKVVLIVDKFPFMNKFPNRPLVFILPGRAVLFVVFCTLSELVRAIGKDEVIRLFLGKRATIN